MDVLDRLYDYLRTTRAAEPDPAAPLTIADVYQRLIPYRTVRAELGIFEFAAYEHALLRLLAGEGGFLQVLDPRALEEIHRELASVNPILGIYRDYGEAAVSIVNGGAPTGPVAVEQTEAGQEPVDREPVVVKEPAAASPPVAADQCPACYQTLPDIDGLRFCPFCGEPQGPRPCVDCGTILDREWDYCIRCGARQA